MARKWPQDKGRRGFASLSVELGIWAYTVLEWHKYGEVLPKKKTSARNRLHLLYRVTRPWWFKTKFCWLRFGSSAVFARLQCPLCPILICPSRIGRERNKPNKSRRDILSSHHDHPVLSSRKIVTLLKFSSSLRHKVPKSVPNSSLKCAVDTIHNGFLMPPLMDGLFASREKRDDRARIISSWSWPTDRPSSSQLLAAMTNDSRFNHLS